MIYGQFEHHLILTFIIISLVYLEVNIEKSLTEVNINSRETGEWTNANISIPDSANKTEMEEARKEFLFEGPGSFTLNLKSSLSVEEDVDYIEVNISHSLLDVSCLHLIGLYSSEGCREK